LKGIDEKFWKPVPEGDYSIFKHGPLYLDIALRAKMINFFCTIFINHPVIHTIPAIIYFATGAHPLGGSCRMIVTESSHFFLLSARAILRQNDINTTYIYIDSNIMSIIKNDKDSPTPPLLHP